MSAPRAPIGERPPACSAEARARTGVGSPKSYFCITLLGGAQVVPHDTAEASANPSCNFEVSAWRRAVG